MFEMSASGSKAIVYRLTPLTNGTLNYSMIQASAPAARCLCAVLLRRRRRSSYDSLAHEHTPFAVIDRLWQVGGGIKSGVFCSRTAYVSMHDMLAHCPDRNVASTKGTSTSTSTSTNCQVQPKYPGSTVVEHIKCQTESGSLITQNISKYS